MPRAIVSTTDLIDVTDRMAILIAAVRGDFDEEIAALKKEREALEAERALVGTPEQVRKMRADADDYERAAKARADELNAAASALADAAQARLTEAEQRVQAVSQREATASKVEADLGRRGTVLDDRERAILAAQQTTDAGLTARAAAIDLQQAALVAGQQQLQADRDAFNQKLLALKA